MNKKLKQIVVNIFLIEKLPYLLSLLFLGIGVTVSYIVKEIKAWPLLEYSISQPKEMTIDTSQIFCYKITISNITSNNRIDDISILVDYSNAEGREIISAQPLFSAPSHFPEFYFKLEKFGYELNLKYFQPKWNVDIILCTSHKNPPKLSFHSKETIYLAKKSVKTFLFKNQLNIVAILTIVWMILLIIYLFVYAKIKPNESK